MIIKLAFSVVQLQRVRATFILNLVFTVIFNMENFDVIAENVVGAIIKQACQGVEDRLGENFT